MTDRELLEDAAKAAGLTFKDYAYDAIAGLWIEYTLAERKHMTISSDNGWHWNPLTDDGDALRLAVQLGISIEYVGDDDGKIIGSTTNGHEFECVDAANPYAATRRAITRAAAEIGRAMP